MISQEKHREILLGVIKMLYKKDKSNKLSKLLEKLRKTNISTHKGFYWLPLGAYNDKSLTCEEYKMKHRARENQ